jgi:hypothetical protein
MEELGLELDCMLDKVLMGVVVKVSVMLLPKGIRLEYDCSTRLE